MIPLNQNIKKFTNYNMERKLVRKTNQIISDTTFKELYSEDLY